MARQKLTIEELIQIDQLIERECIPYTYDTKEYPIEVIVSKYEKDQIFVPPYQRDFVWDIKRKSRFIESVFLGVPIMPFLVSISGDEAELEIIDGSQRIRTLVTFINNGFKLEGLKKLSDLNGMKFSDFPLYRQNKFKLRDFRFHVVTDKATTEVRADIFDRVNTSYKKLTSSEIRKGAYHGRFYIFIQDLSKNEQLQKLCPLPEAKIKRSEYEELLLRFYTYTERYLLFKHDVAPFLDDFLKDMNKSDFNEEIEKRKLMAVLNFVERYFEAPYFARRGMDKATPRVRFEAISVGVCLALQQKPDLEPPYMDWIYSDEFKEHTTTDASNNKNKLIGRIEFVRDCLLGIILKDTLHYGNC